MLPASSPLLAALLAVLTGSLALAACGQPAPRQQPSTAYALLLRGLYRGTVPTLTPAALAQELAHAPGRLQLLDVRAPEEYAVSHLAGARFVDAGRYQTSPEALAGLDPDRPVVVYCSVGARSEKLGEYLQQRGFRHVRNLYGGLFEWVNQGHPVVNAQGPTQAVHPYSAAWGIWLRK